MWPYIICFIITSLFAALDEYCINRIYKYKRLHIFCAIVVILLPAILAGCRDYTIGTDVNVYAKPVFDRARYSSSFLSLSNSVSNSYMGSIEPGFLLLAFIVSRFTTDAHWFLFAISLFIGVFIYASLYRMREHCSMFLGTLIYLTMIYPDSLNLMRQCMAISIILFSITFLLEKKFVRYFSLIIISYFFHRSALIALTIPIVCWVIGDDRKTANAESIKVKIKWWLRVIVLSLLIAGFTIGFQAISQMLIAYGIVSSKYLNFVTQINSDQLSTRAVFYYFLIAIIIFGRRNQNWYGYTFLTIEIANLILYSLRSQMVWLYRVGLYFMYCRIFSASQVHLRLGQIFRTGKIKHEDIYAVLCIIFCILYWQFFYVIWNNNEIIPYTSQLLGIF